jgi:23S rRNA pseudouridine2605 synthase
VHLNRAMSKLGILSRSQATDAILGGRVRVDGRVVLQPAALVDPATARIHVDGRATAASEWRTILLNKPRGVVTTRRDPEGRPTVYDVLKGEGEGLVPVGRLDQATSGLLLLTTDTELAAWITDPHNAIPRVYIVTVRGRMTPEQASALEAGVAVGGDRSTVVRAEAVVLRKTSNRESHLTVELREGRNRQVRRMFEAIGHAVTRLKRVKLAGLELNELEPGQWRDLGQQDIKNAFPSRETGRRRRAGG